MELLGRFRKLLEDTSAGDAQAVAKAIIETIALTIEEIQDFRYAPTYYNDEQKLKWNRSSEGAIRQVKERNYPAILKDYGGEILLVGIFYDVKRKAHSCVQAGV